MIQLKENPFGRGFVWPLSVAPMMDWTDRHYRYFMRHITRHTLLYTEMKTTGAVLHGDREKILGFSEFEKPLALQLGGDNPADMAESARIAENLGYDEVNINVGCPSDRVQRGNFGACLMATPHVVADCVEAMRDAVSIPVTVKCRIGIDDLPEYEDLFNFSQQVLEAGADRLTVHARIAILAGLSPKENRTVPPLRYEDVYRLKQAFPQHIVEINGGIKTMDDVAVHLQSTDGVMIGRAAYENPYIFSEADQRFFGDNRIQMTRREIVEAMMPYIESVMDNGYYPNSVTRHMLGLFAFQPGNRAFRRYISENVYKPGTPATIIRDALQGVPDHVLDARLTASPEAMPASR